VLVRFAFSNTTSSLTLNIYCSLLGLPHSEWMCYNQ
jgi:hypothetical protein